MNHGELAENIIHKICEKMFISDFVISNPKFNKATGKKKFQHEIADTLVLFANQLISFQVKSRNIPSVSNIDNELSRINRLVEKGGAQLASINAALRSDILTVKNRVGAQITLQSNDIQKIIGVVIINIAGDEQLKSAYYEKITTKFTVNKNIPTHIFTSTDLELISNEIDTIPDFLKYLNRRESVHRKNLLNGSKNENDYLAFYKVKENEVLQAIENNTELNIPHGFWDHYESTYATKINERDTANQPSYEIDKIIGVLHKSIGTNDLLQGTFKDHKENTIEDYFSAITELSSFDRVTRRNQALKLFEIMNKADKQPDGSHTLSINNKTGLIFFSSSQPREMREKRLNLICNAAYYRFNLKKVIGLATDPASANKHFFEVIKIENQTHPDHEELAKLGYQIFGKIKKETMAEYSIKKKCSSRFPLNKKCPCGSERKFKNCCSSSVLNISYKK